jgi:FkbM family methyltransferase
MGMFTTVANRLTRAIQALDDPRLFLLRRRGLSLELYQKLNQPWLRALNIATVLDIGANVGHFAITASTAFPNAKIYSFEPVPDCFEQLQARIGNIRGASAFNLALGDKSEDLVFERNTFTPSSSFLKMADAHKVAFPFTRESRHIRVKVERLDTVVETLVITDPMLVKIDVQGYENHVLCGGEQTIRRAKIIAIETSFEVLYEGQPLFDTIYRKLVDWGFAYIGSLDQLCNPQTGRILQADSIFIKQT